MLLNEIVPWGIILHAKLSHILFSSFPNSLIGAHVWLMLLYLEKAVFAKAFFMQDLQSDKLVIICHSLEEIKRQYA